MDKKKEIELIRKRSAELNQQYEDLMQQIAAEVIAAPGEREQSLIDELESLKTEWETLIKELKDKNAECNALLVDLREVSKIMREMGFKKPVAQAQ